MAFASPTTLPPRGARHAATPLKSAARTPSPTKHARPATRRAPAMVEQNTILAVGTIVVGLGAGLGLVAWTENQGVRTTERENMQPCVECKGDTTVVCSVCNGSKEDPLDSSKQCSYCDGIGVITCFNCSGSGIQPRFLDRLSPDDFMD